MIFLVLSSIIRQQFLKRINSIMTAKEKLFKVSVISDLIYFKIKETQTGQTGDQLHTQHFQDSLEQC